MLASPALEATGGKWKTQQVQQQSCTGLSGGRDGRGSYAKLAGSGDNGRVRGGLPGSSRNGGAELQLRGRKDSPPPRKYHWFQLVVYYEKSLLQCRSKFRLQR